MLTRTSTLTLCLALLPAAVRPGGCQQVRLDLLKPVAKWTVNTDKPGAKMTMSPAGEGIRVVVTAEGKQEDYPKARLGFAAARDCRPYAQLHSRLRVTCDDPTVRQKRIAFVFYDEQVRLPGYPGNPMKQQVIAHTVAVNKWVEFTDWLMPVKRAALRQVDLYLYELPPEKAHRYTWEIAKLELVKVSGQGVIFDTRMFARNKLTGAVRKPVATVKTDDGLALTLGSRGQVFRVAVGDAVAGAGDADTPTGLLVRDAAADTPPLMVGGIVRRNGDEIEQMGELKPLGLKVRAVFRNLGTCLEVSGAVTDTRGEDRAVTVYFALPVTKGPWQWWDSVAASRTTADETGELNVLERNVAYGTGGCHSKYPLAALTLPGRLGLSLAIRMDEPVVHRITYNPGLGLFFAAFDFGLVPQPRVDGRSLAEAPFRVLLYRHDPAWGFRSALQRYYELFPGFFDKRVKREGGWYVWGDMSKTKGALAAGFGFHWGPGGVEAVKWDNAHGPLALFYIEPETYQQTMEDFDQRPTYDQALARLKKLAAGDAAELAQVAAQPYRVYPLGPGKEGLTRRIQTTCRAVETSLSYDDSDRPYCRIGRFGWMRKSKWGAILACNLSPRLPRGKGWLNRRKIIGPSLAEMEKAGAHYDGIGLDSFGGYGQAQRVDYRRSHFPYADYPLSFSARDHRPVYVAAFATVEWLRDLAKDMHARGKVLMANCSWGSTPAWLTFAAPYLDIFGAEAPKFGDPDFIRAVAYRKPCTDLPYKPRPEWEIPWHYLHAIHPGHGNDLAAMTRCAGMLKKLVAAGWEPLTGARTTAQQVRLERFGRGRQIYLVAHNGATKPTRASVQLDTAVLGTEDFAAVETSTGKPLTLQQGSFALELGPRETVVVSLVRK